MCKVKEAYKIFKTLVRFYGTSQLINYINDNNINSFDLLNNALPADPARLDWDNIGGQLLPKIAVELLLSNIRNNSYKSWSDVHDFYNVNSVAYKEQKLQHAFASLLEMEGKNRLEFTEDFLRDLLKEAVQVKEWMVKNIRGSREKDYQSPFRKMLYDNDKEMEAILGSINDNVFIRQQEDELEELKSTTSRLLQNFGK